jgi:epoxide hydrolase-like predicted phosphatase
MPPDASDLRGGADTGCSPAGTRRIAAIVCDFGGVLTSPLREAFLAVQSSIGVTPGQFGVALQELRERDGVNPLYELERGRITEVHFLTELGRQLSATLGRVVSVHGFGSSLLDELHPNAEMIGYMRSLRERAYSMAICTNNVREWEAQWRAKLPVDEIFDVVVDSAFVGSRKPERRIYEVTLERLGVEAREALFIDDLEVNCNGARELGMSAVHFRTTEQAIDDMEAALADRE